MKIHTPEEGSLLITLLGQQTFAKLKVLASPTPRAAGERVDIGHHHGVPNWVLSAVARRL